MSAKALLDANPRPTADEVRAALAGNLCRCANYNRYVEAVVAAGAGRDAHRDRGTGGAAMSQQNRRPPAGPASRR